MNETDGLWRQKNETLSDKTAEKEYGLTRNEIYDTINAGLCNFEKAVCMAVFGIGSFASKLNSWSPKNTDMLIWLKRKTKKNCLKLTRN